MKTINDIITLINENPWCADCKRKCPYYIGKDMGFCGLDTTIIAIRMLQRGEYQ